MFLAWSEDKGRTWGPPIPLSPPLDPDRYSCNGSGVLLMLSDDRWMYPFETWLPTGATSPLDQKAAAIFSSDQGQAWPEMAVVADDPTGRYIHWDHSGTVLLPGAHGRGRIYETMWVSDAEANADLSIHFTLLKFTYILISVSMVIGPLSIGHIIFPFPFIPIFCPF